MMKTLEQLKLLSTFYWIVGGIYVFLGCLGLVQSRLMQSFSNSYSEPLRMYGKTMSMMPLVMTVVLWGLAIALFISARNLRSQSGYNFCFVVAVMSCFFMPIGTILGVFTLVVLVRSEAKTLFGKDEHAVYFGH